MKEGAHILVGIVSKRLGESCSQQDYTVFTSVSALLPWIESSIKENGGMASCGFNFSAPPSLGMLSIVKRSNCRKNFQSMHPKMNHQYVNSNNKTTSIVQVNHWSLPLRLVFSYSVANQQKDNLLPSRPLDSKTVQSLLYPRPVMVLDLSSPTLNRHSWLSVEGGGWENQTPLIASHSM